MKRIKQSVAVAIFDPDDRNRLLVVQRPDNDQDLPNVWGLPASSLLSGESFEDAVLRTGGEKLGVSLATVRELARGSQERADYTLEMRLFESMIVGGDPVVPQPVDGVTQYQDWAWDTPDRLRAGAAAGSLCCILADRLPG
ncbi:MAG: NUDIX domain-containing protein [Gemmatimonadota bacterium]